MQSEKAKLIFKNQQNQETTIELDILKGSLGHNVLDLSGLNKAELFTFDPGFRATASCDSKITFIDGAKGILLHRGYPIEQLAQQSDFVEVSYLLLNGELPNKEEYLNFANNLRMHTLVHEQLIKFYQGFRRDAHPMAIMCGVVGALSSFYHDKLDISSSENRKFSAIRLIAKIPTLAAMCYKYSIGQPFVYPNNDLSYTENFLNMMFSLPSYDYKVNPVVAKALDTIFILHADHEQNASTSTVRLAGSSGANPFACIAAGIAALWGPAHGGANEAVLKMLEEIEDVANIPKYIALAKDKSSSYRLMGFGHRVYKNFDPRANIMREQCHKVLKELGISSKKLEIAMELERIALSDPYFIEKKLYPNIDFYSGIILEAIGIPTNMFTVIFALARTTGWISQWHEMISNNSSINRPRQLYTGYTARDYIDLEAR